MNETDIRGWLRLSRLELVPRKAYDLVQAFGSPDAIFGASEAELRAIDGMTDKAVAKVLGPEPPGIDAQMGRIVEWEITMLPVTDPEYPVNLRQIYDPPAVLYVRGSLDESDRFSVSIVGSRRASIYGRTMSERIAKELAGRGICVVSGGARGIDAAAHQGALKGSGRTIAVLGCGVDIAYPSEHRALYAKIAETGAVVSEFSPGTPPEAWRFPSRNRIISGLSSGVLVIQAPNDSGALITARYAAEHGRDIFALPGNVDDIRNEGCHALIRDGAKLVTSAVDILSEIGVHAGEERTVQAPAPIKSLTETERKLVELLSLQPKHVDHVITESGFPAPTVTGTLTMLEMKGIVKRVPGNAYVRAL
jgi:DNA processing protein